MTNTDTLNKSIFAVIGSTGNCGSALIQRLLKSPQNSIHAHCRSRAKLHRILPQVIDNKQVRVFEGSITDVDLMAACLRGTKAVFLVASTNANIPGCRIAQDTAATVIRALKKIKADAASTTTELTLPKLVLLSSSTIDDHLARHMPWWFRPVMLTAASNVYEDLRVAEQLLRSHDDLVPTVFIKPGGLSVDVARGYRLTLDEEESFVSYQDLAAGMVEAAESPDGRFDGRNVGVVNAQRGVGAKFPRGTPITILTGLARHYLPWLHPYLPVGGP
ncbi:putative NAD-dependent epimerase/dehydratase [Podospora appendiculata]|uniref:NAD-dependent epimerase/dehydratase n=1 Tax=Podospora appendiculata TaxID=314037 RepID=A0AAE0X4V3_9PEZI|nr:putative NAD-dependent epimerase/dehydratase [Podospora appendiculata]